jgi:uncharacterized membrane protein YeaQ/YmgE (transglycosylase-associated protein family)
VTRPLIHYSNIDLFVRAGQNPVKLGWPVLNSRDKSVVSGGIRKVLVNIIVWIVLGGLAGWIASMVMGRDAQMGAAANIIVGIIGAILGGFLMNQFGQSGVTGFNIYSLLVAIVGAIVLLFLYSLIRRAT